MNNTNTNPSETNRPLVIFRGLIYVLMGIQIVGLLWIVEQIIFWTHQDDEDPTLTLLILPFVLFIVASPLLIRLAKNRSLLKRSSRMILMSALFVQAIISWLIYSQLNRFSLFAALPIPELDPIRSGWFSTEIMPLYLACIWCYLAFLVIMPCLLILLIGTSRASVDENHSLHLGGIIFGILNGIRWGSNLSGMLHVFVWILILLPILAILDQYIKPGESEHVPYFLLSKSMRPLLAFLFMSGLWLFILELHALGIMDKMLFWLILAGSNLIMFSIRGPVQRLKSKRNHQFSWGFWILLEIATVGICLINLSLIMMNMYWVWLVLGLICSAAIPDLLQELPDQKRPLNVVQLFILGITLLVGVLFPLLPNAYDPISSYVSVLFCVLNLFLTFPEIKQGLHGTKKGTKS